MGLWEQELSMPLAQPPLSIPPQDLLPAEGVTSGLLSPNNTVTKAGWTLRGSPVPVQLFERESRKDSKSFGQEV